MRQKNVPNISLKGLLFIVVHRGKLPNRLSHDVGGSLGCRTRFVSGDLPHAHLIMEGFARLLADVSYFHRVTRKHWKGNRRRLHADCVVNKQILIIVLFFLGCLLDDFLMSSR